MLCVCLCGTCLIGFEFEKDCLIVCCGRRVLGSLLRATWMLCSASRRIFFFAFLSFFSCALCDLIARVTWVSGISSALLERRFVAIERKSGECVLSVFSGRLKRRPCHLMLSDLCSLDHPLSCNDVADVKCPRVPNEDGSVVGSHGKSTWKRSLQTTPCKSKKSYSTGVVYSSSDRKWVRQTKGRLSSLLLCRRPLYLQPVKVSSTSNNAIWVDALCSRREKKQVRNRGLPSLQDRQHWSDRRQ